MGLLNSCRKIITFVLGRRYRPELHYMRGPGPKWSERHAAIIRPINKKAILLRKESAVGRG
jgi:hypothetical protein